jgi:hypothetical protein
MSRNISLLIAAVFAGFMIWIGANSRGAFVGLRIFFWGLAALIVIVSAIFFFLTKGSA